jgi:hypothetical protein
VEHERARSAHHRERQSERDGTAHDPRLALVSRLGNQAAARLLATRRTLSRFESNEHKRMGDVGSGGASMELVPGFSITFGDMTAMAGDYFASVKQMQDLAAVPGSSGAPYSVAGSIDEVKYVLYVEVQKSMKEEDFDKAVVNAAKRRYYGLASQNVSHFTNPELGDELLTPEQRAAKGTANNAGSYRDNHILAIEAAVDAGTGVCGPLDQALLQEGFASHFLTDAFAAGHMRTPRASISDWWNPKVPMFWHNLKLWLAENIAIHMNENATVPSIATVNYLWHQAIETLEGVMAEKGMPDLTFGDAIGGALHDLDNLEGVEAQVGDDFVKLVGDGQVLDKQGRDLAQGAETLKRAAASVKVSLRDIHDAYDAAMNGQDAETVKQALMTPDGLFRAEQLWPAALPQNTPQPTWMVASVDELLKQARFRTALHHFAHEKAETLGGEVKLEGWFVEAKKAALKWTLAKLQGSEDGVVAVFREIIDYTPGLVSAGPGGGTGDLDGVFGQESDDNAVDYYRKAKEKGALGTLSVAQRIRLIELGLDGPTLGDDEEMIVGLLDSNLSHVVPVLSVVGWRRVWDDVDGENCRSFVRSCASVYWSAQDYARKRDEVSYLADGVTGETAQETIVAILRTCSGAEVRKIDDEVGGMLGLSFDLEGYNQDEFDKLKARP